MEIPAGLKYTKDHEWVKVDGSNATMGITAFAQSELGDVVFVDLPAIGKSVKQKGTICVVESTKAASDVYAPLSGEVCEVNVVLKDSPDLVNKSPYADGWMVKLKNVPAGELEALMSAEQYRAHLGDKA